MTEIIIENEQEKIEIKPEILETIKTAVDATLDFEKCDFDAEVSVTIVDNAEIKELNNETRGIDRPTDVLSFPILEFDEDGNIIDCDCDYDGGSLILGDIVISAERAAEQATEFGHSFRREIAFLTVHSMLHLLGYDHETSEADEALMFSKQEKILEGIGILRGE